MLTFLIEKYKIDIKHSCCQFYDTKYDTKWGKRQQIGAKKIKKNARFKAKNAKKQAFLKIGRGNTILQHTIYCMVIS